jgi:acyl-CoA synthetase (AMP-forming)/AMP-acid ligase II/alkylation response protein AidB-like acyl-CoA dehydrogenase/acyl carrier protein
MTTKIETPRSVREQAPFDLIDLLRRRAEAHPDRQACLYLGDGEELRSELTFGELDLQARAIAARLQGLGAAGECAVLLYPPGLEFLGAFFGCLYANVIAVPLPVPRLKASVTQFVGIVEDLHARILLTTAMALTRMNRMDLPVMKKLAAITTEDTPPELARAWRATTVERGAAAYLQYTSGSTANRKGVIVTHESVIANLQAIAERFAFHEQSVSVNWLPHIHDLGLVNGMLQPLYHGHRNILMSPNAFVQQPFRWLDAISRYRGTYSNGPNFGYDLCVRRSTAEQRERLDLSSWDVALNGAEPVRQQTIDDFVATFGPCGFRREAMFPAYGLAEATLMVSGGPAHRVPVTVSLDVAQLERGRVVESAGPASRVMVGCGRALADTSIAIVNPETGRRSGDDEIGEIWVHGPGLAAGYWQRPEDSEQAFRARLAGADDDAPYLRTGDLGFLRDGELFISGRLKDLIIVRGDNHYPQDIEWTVEQCHEAFRPGCGAAFSIDAEDGEQLVVVFELEREFLRTVKGEELERLARRAVAEQHDLHLHTLVLLRTGTVPRTSSGKIQRRQCRADFLSGGLAVIWRSAAPAPPVDGAEPVLAPQPVSPARQTSATRDDSSGMALCGWLRDYASQHVNSRLMDERRSITPHVMLDFGNHGVLGLLVPREYGGAGLGWEATLRVLQQLGAIDQTLAMMSIVHNVLGIGPILRHATPAVRSEWLPRLAAGRELVAFALTEPAAGSNPQGIMSMATPAGPGAWSLTGQKSWSGTAGWASVINVFAQNVDDSGEPRGISGFVVPRGTPGLRMGPEALTLGMRGMVQNTIFLEGAVVTREQSLGEPGNGMKVAQEGMMHGRLAIGGAVVGGMKRCLQLLVRYAERRTISTGRLLDNPVLLARVGEWSGALTAIESLTTVVARRLDQGESVPPDVFVVCKVAGSEWFGRAADDLVQFLGGRGYIETNIAAQLLRDARVTRILEGPSEALNMYLGSRVVNDASALRAFLIEVLVAPEVANRLSEVALEIVSRCLANPRFGDAQQARRWAYALVGRVAMDAVLLAATPREGKGHHRAWAEGQFERTVVSVVTEATHGFHLRPESLLDLTDQYVSSIGDVEQSLAGEDHELDSMLRRPLRSATTSPKATAPESAAPPDAPAAAPAPAASTNPARFAAPVPARSPADAASIERFIVRWIAKELKIAEAAIDAGRSVFDFGLDSVTAVMLGAALEEWLRIDISPELVYDIPVIRRFAAHLADRQKQA